MKRLKRTIQWIVGVLLGTYLTVVLLLSLPVVQSWIGERTANVLSNLLGTKVEVGRIQVSFTGRLLIDDLKLWDRQDKEMLTVTRTGARISLLPFLQEGDIHINNAILFGAHAHLYQENPETDPNFKFVIDAFKSNNEEKKPMPHISIGSILVRHTYLTYDQQWKPETPGRFNPSHISVKDLSLSAQLHHLCEDSLSVELRKMSFTEQSNFSLKSAEGEISMQGKTWNIADFRLSTKRSEINLHDIQVDLQNRKASGTIKASLTPADGEAFLSQLGKLDETFDTSLSFVLDSLSAGITGLLLSSQNGALSADIPNLCVNNLKDSIPDVSAKVKHLAITPEVLDFVRPFVKELPEKVSSAVEALGETSLEGDLAHQSGTSTFDVSVTTKLGQIQADGSLRKEHLCTKVNAEDFRLGNLLKALQQKNSADSIPLIENVSLIADADLMLPTLAGTKAGTKSQSLKSKIPTGTLNATCSEATVKKYTYHNIRLALSHHGEQIGINLEAKDPALTANLHANATLSTEHYDLQGLMDVEHLRLQDMHLTHKGPSDIRAKVGIDLAGHQLDNLAGDISIPHLILTDEEGSFTLTSMQLISRPTDGERHLTFQSPYLNAKADGTFEWKDIVRFGQQTVHHWIPGIVKAPSQSPSDCRGEFALTLTDPTPLERIAGIPLKLDEGPLMVNAAVDSERESLQLNASTPRICYGEQELFNLNFATESHHEEMSTNLSASRIMKNVPVDIKANIKAENQTLTTTLNWDNHQPAVTQGTIAMKGRILREANQLNIDGEILPTSLQVSDTLWNIHPTHLTFQDGRLTVDGLRVTMEDGNRWLTVRGKASKSQQDTLKVDLQGIELGYIFDLVHVKPLSLRGQVSGKLYGTHLFARPEARGRVSIPHLLFNEGDMGRLDADVAWGVTPGTLDIDGDIQDSANQAVVKAKGNLHLIKDPVQTLDLRIQCQRANLYFLNRYVSGIMEDIQGRATGHVNVYGTFGEVELAGDAIINEGALTVPSIGGRYHVVNEHVVLRPDGLTLDNIKGYDPMGGPDKPDHFAIINGQISYNHFKNMRYNFDISGQNILGYNYPEPDELPFWGVVYGTGKVQLSGSPGQTTINIDARPDAGSTLTYKVATPETLTQSKFITFVDEYEKQDEEADGSNTKEEEDHIDGDMHLNFNLDITPDAEMRLLMDPVAGDYISLYGNSRIRASYYNKGNFRMYGTYRVDHGIYRMSIQDVIRKDFQFKKGGTIVFGGNPFSADLGLQAIYTVPSVSLNDLSARGTFSNNTVRVNCLMNLGGKAGEPRITFDFDIPNVNEDELRMVRSLISTEEERNLQVIYLLGIGRFYTYDYTGTQAQSSTAMNSLLSSTLSGQLNQMFTNLMGGNQNWNIGANLSTGDMGWSDMDVEGMLSGRLLNNRLLINGNFGYRDNPVAASNFIGDFDLQWILNKQGNLILKAYSETNDRYFTKSALTTQGVGLLLKKDFIRWTDLFHKKRQKKEVQDEAQP